MKNKNIYFSMLLVALSFGTAWAIRGQFGHEHGAAWAGAIGSLSTLLVVKRKDWLNKAIYVTLAGALGWGLGGMMSYGLVVGYGRADDFGNVFYGLTMLLLIGGLYGFLGGGFFGVALSDTKKNPVKWVSLIVEMTVGGILFYFFLIEQFEWLINPPRSEVWAVCLGIAAALTWYMIRQKNYAALRVAICASLGAGFGFAFGNFLQVIGRVSEIPFNFWNVMEYSLGFFGGLGLAYGTLTTSWETENQDDNISRKQMFHLIMLVLIIPFIMWQQNFEWDRIQKTYVKLLSSESFEFYYIIQWGSLLLILSMAFFWILKFNKFNTSMLSKVSTFFFAHWALYMILSFIITGAIVSIYRIEQYLYLVNFLVVLSLINIANPIFNPHALNPKRYLKLLLGIFVFLAILSYIAIQTHGEIKGSHKRFGENQAMVDTVKK